MSLPRKRSPPSEIQKPICIVDDDEAVADSLQALCLAGSSSTRLVRNRYRPSRDRPLARSEAGGDVDRRLKEEGHVGGHTHSRQTTWLDPGVEGPRLCRFSDAGSDKPSTRPQPHRL